MNAAQVAELVAALDLKEHDYVIDAVLLARVKDFDSGVVALSISTTDDVDWVVQLGIIDAAQIITTKDLHKTTGDD